VSLTWALLDREREFAASFARAAVDGIALDRDQVEKLVSEHTGARQEARDRVRSATDGLIDNPKSSTQVGPYLDSTGRYVLPRSAKTGKPGAAKGVLEPYAYLGDTLAADILAYRHHDTALTLLLEPRRLLCAQGDGRVRTSILTLQANTGRTSSRNENLQQVSRQGGMRATHRADEGFLIISADMASVEIRTGAALSGDVSMKALIALGDAHPEKKKEYDFHWRTAIICYGAEATKEHRYNCKRVNFAKMYGSGKEAAAGQVGIPLQEVSAAFDAFDQIAPQYKQWDRQMRQFVKAGGNAYTTYNGRDVYLTGKGEHAAGNAAVQGTAREFLVEGVLKWRAGPWGDCLIVPVHDEVVAFDIPEDQAEAATAYLVQCLENELNGVRIAAEPNPPSPYWMDAS
jgi:DNA polymerase I-like protein with 3'-5' exonuclease and polymerase domains